MIKAINLITMLSMILASILLYQLKYEVGSDSERVTSLRREIDAERERINILKAEWSYLNQPERIQRLATRYLDLSATQAHQIVTFGDLPERSPAPMPYAPAPAASGFAGQAPGSQPGSQIR